MISQYKSQAEKLKQSFELSIRSIDNSMLSIYQTSELYNFVTGSEQFNEETIVRQRRIENLLKILAHSLNDYSNVYLYLNERQYLFRVNAKYLHVEQETLDKETNWIKQTQLQDGKLVIVHEEGVGNMSLDSKGETFLFIGRSIPDVIAKKQTGVIGVDLGKAYFESIVGTDDALERIDVLGADGQVLYSTMRDHKATGKQLLIESEINEYGWRVVTYLSQNTLNQIAWEAVRPTVAWGVLFLVIAILLWVMLTQQISTPLNRLVRNMREVGKGNFNSDVLRSDKRRRDEFGFLEQHFYSMVVRIEELIKHEYQLKTNESVAWMKALQAQINPHFLYNTLASIYSEALEAGAEDVCRMVKSLSAMFRYTTEFEQDIVLLSDEIAHARNYLDIQKFRFEEKLQFHIDIANHLLDKPMVKLSLQPIVENAIAHGISQIGQGIIMISAIEQDEQLVITVEDSAGMIQPEEARLLTHLITNGKRPSESVGLSNVHQRIIYHFPESAGFSIEGESGMTKARLSWKVGSKV